MQVYRTSPLNKHISNTCSVYRSAWLPIYLNQISGNRCSSVHHCLFVWYQCCSICPVQSYLYSSAVQKLYCTEKVCWTDGLKISYVLRKCVVPVGKKWCKRRKTLKEKSTLVFQSWKSIQRVQSCRYLSVNVWRWSIPIWKLQLEFTYVKKEPVSLGHFDFLNFSC